jgi:hypothetical protein
MQIVLNGSSAQGHGYRGAREAGTGRTTLLPGQMKAIEK